MNTTPESERVRVVFCGRRNTGKSSLVNAVAGQPVSIVSEVPGTTTDPVRKTMEMLPLGPVLLVDTAGVDDDQETVGGLRLDRTRRELRTADLAVVVSDAEVGIGDCEEKLIGMLRRDGVPFVCVVNKCDLLPVQTRRDGFVVPVIFTSTLTGVGIETLKSAIANMKPDEPEGLRIIGDRLRKGDIVVLVTPQDSAAPKGRIILPQQQTIRDILDAGAIVVACQTAELPATLAALKTPPRMVVTDSQVFGEVRAIVPPSIELTSFSILFARYKGDFDVLSAGVAAIDKLRDNDRVLIAEGCTHHRQCEDIGTVKIPRWLREYTGRNLQIESVSVSAFPDDLGDYALVIHCGACMLTRREMRRRISAAQTAGIPITNYGLAIAKMRT